MSNVKPRTHAAAIKRQRELARTPDSDVRSAKCNRSRERNRARIEQRYNAANSRQEKRDKLSPADQLKVLDGRLGIGIGAGRERARLSALITSETAKT